MLPKMADPQAPTLSSFPGIDSSKLDDVTHYLDTKK
jgi:hypothetical protein